ncbi:MAG TPA: SprB repeat-containing protein, partial [Bacteroidia bacterium]|nr:SprB repeat-containing protein [Bacteroidia bacterium]
MKKQLSRLFTLVLSCQLIALSYLSAQTGKWTAVKNLPPHLNYGVCLLMTDGTVICHNISGGGSGYGWDRLTPDIHGSYANGTWDSIAPMNNDRLFFSSQILPDGKVYAAGGEYGGGGVNGEVYDPVANTWTVCGPIPAGWSLYDANSQLLYDGTVMEGPQIGSNNSFNILNWDPNTLVYTTEPNSLQNHDEAEWLKLPDSSVLFVGIASQNANRYIPQTATWVNDANTPGNLYDPYGEEAGCALMLPNGKAVFFGATPYNAIYTPSGNSSPGTWASADSFPVIQGTRMGQPDAAGAMMVNGHILLAVSPIGTAANEFNTPAYFLEYDYTTNTFTQVMDTIPGQHGDSIAYIASYQTQMLDLPDGTVLLSISQTDTLPNQYYIYTPGSGPIPQGKPTLENVIPLSCNNYRITGKLFNGISEGAAYGDDWQMSTNWPLVRLTNGTNVYYAKTTNWNRLGAVQTDSAEDTAYFALPSLPGGNYTVQVVVNGFASSPIPLTTFGVAITATNITSCFGTGSATASASFGAAPYTYSWSPSGGTDSIASGLSAGTYTITVTEVGGCTASA